MDKCNRYSPLDDDVWQGRIDEPIELDSYRWHQIVKLIDLNNDKLLTMKGSDLGFCFLGFHCDEGIIRNKGRKGAAKAPVQIRREMSNFSCNLPKLPELYDAGDIHCWDRNLEKSQEDLSWAIEKILSLNLFPVVLGGGHEIAFGHFKGLLNSILNNKKEKSPNIGIINFDSHFDLRPYSNGPNSGTMFLQIADLCREKGVEFSYLCVGIQKYANTVRLFKTADELNVQYIFAKDINVANLSEIAKRLDSYIKKHEYIYLTVCIDVFSSSYAPGVSSHQPFGIQAETGLKLIKHVAKWANLISFDLAEVSPRFDKDNRTAKLAGIIIYAILNVLLGSEDFNGGGV